MIDPVDLRVFVYDFLKKRGMPPSVPVVAAQFATSDEEARRSLASLNIGKTVLVDRLSGEIWMAGPFAAAPTPYEVRGRDTTWWGNCAWDMLGIAFVVDERVRVDARCTECSLPMRLEFGPTRPPVLDAVVHFLLPARHWYDDIGFT
jgi:hypothetical protein